jgi:hypothetical protein
MRLRWLIKDGEKVLQYEHDEVSFVKETRFSDDSTVGIIYDKAIHQYSWRDVEIVDGENLEE